LPPVFHFLPITKMALQLALRQLAGNPADTPAAPPPPGQTPNFVNPESRSPEATAVISVLTAFAVIIVCLRVYVKATVTKIFGWDDSQYIPFQKQIFILIYISNGDPCCRKNLISFSTKKIDISLQIKLCERKCLICVNSRSLIALSPDSRLLVRDFGITLKISSDFAFSFT